MSPARSTGIFMLLAALAATTAAQQSANPAPQPKPAQPAAEPQAPAPQPKPAFEAKVVTTEAIHAVVLPMKGSYSQHPEAFARLAGFLSAHGVTPTGAPFGLYYSDPSVGEENLVWEIGFPVPAGVTAEAPFEIKDIPAALSAVHVHKGPMEELGNAWGEMMQWVFGNGYQPSVPAIQIFKGDLQAGAGEVEMRVAVQK
jgi:DNA gyrase inhibitor GyrI